MSVRRRWIICGIAILAALGAGSYAAYQILESPGSQVFGKTLVSGPKNQRVIALTYDDGPNPPYTDELLSVLRDEHVHATFFVVGRAVAAYPEVVRREVSEGNAIGNHTWSHGHLLLYGSDSLRRTLERTDRAIYAATGVHTRLMRPPFGARDWLVLGEVRKLGYTPVMWSVPLANDWEYPARASDCLAGAAICGRRCDHRSSRRQPRHRLRCFPRREAALRPQRRRRGDAPDRRDAQARRLSVRDDPRAASPAGTRRPDAYAYSLP